MNTRIEKIEQYLRKKLNSEATGHDYFHALRVAKISLNISEHVGGNKEIIYVAALVHDLIDHKLFEDIDKETNMLYSKLYESQFDMFEVDSIFEIINNISYSKGKVANTLEGKIVQDADRLDALGAIGIARTFA
ncbi:MAG: HD domain-containing protein, partial [Candidatus Izemoplasma sp.]